MREPDSGKRFHEEKTGVWRPRQALAQRRTGACSIERYVERPPHRSIFQCGCSALARRSFLCREQCVELQTMDAFRARALDARTRQRIRRILIPPAAPFHITTEIAENVGWIQEGV